MGAGRRCNNVWLCPAALDSTVHCDTDPWQKNMAQVHPIDMASTCVDPDVRDDVGSHCNGIAGSIAICVRDSRLLCRETGGQNKPRAKLWHVEVVKSVSHVATRLLAIKMLSQITPTAKVEGEFIEP